MELGKYQVLTCLRKVDFGVYLGNPEEKEDKREEVLLPIKQVPEGLAVGAQIRVFLYKDSQDRLIATTMCPKITLGQVARLRVAEVGRIGAFLDWGLPKDLLLPFREQTGEVRKEDEVLVALYTDKTGRLCATMKLYPYLQRAAGIQKDDQVTGTVYEISQNFGAFVAIDDQYSALVPKKECLGELRVGQKLTARVTGVKADGKVDLSVRMKAYEMLEGDGEKLLKMMQAQGGAFPFTDKAAPEHIKDVTGMSKNEFKRAIGHLLKNGKVEITASEIRMK